MSGFSLDSSDPKEIFAEVQKWCERKDVEDEVLIEALRKLGAGVFVAGDSRQLKPIAIRFQLSSESGRGFGKDILRPLVSNLLFPSSQALAVSTHHSQSQASTTDEKSGIPRPTPNPVSGGTVPSPGSPSLSEKTASLLETLAAEIAGIRAESKEREAAQMEFNRAVQESLQEGLRVDPPGRGLTTSQQLKHDLLGRLSSSASSLGFRSRDLRASPVPRSAAKSSLADLVAQVEARRARASRPRRRAHSIFLEDEDDEPLNLFSPPSSQERVHSSAGAEYTLDLYLSRNLKNHASLRAMVGSIQWGQIRNRREATTLAVMADLLLSNRTVDAMEVLTRRLQALELANQQGGKWHVAEHLESALAQDGSVGISASQLRMALSMRKLQKAAASEK